MNDHEMTPRLRRQKNRLIWQGVDQATPEPLPVKPQKRKVGIIGYGYVGKIVEKFFAERYEVRIYDPAYDGHHTKDEINECDLAVICVPPPMRGDGSCDTSIVEETIAWVEAPLILLRSTVPPGTTDRLQKLTGKRIVFSPEYAGESGYWTPHPFTTDEREMPFYIFGGDAGDCEAIIDYYVVVTGPTKKYHSTTAKIAETVKYFENEYFAWKVMWANEMRETCEAIGVPFWTTRELWALDPRVDSMHTGAFAQSKAFGHESRGFGGKCLPKDTASLYHWAKEAGYEKKVLKAIIEKNLELRKGRGDYPEQFRI